MLSDLEKSVFQTLAYFDLFSHPLKEKEIFENLQAILKRDKIDDRYLQEEIRKILNNLALKKLIEKKGDFWFLEGRSFLVEERKKRENISQKNWLKLKKISRAINRTPFLKGVFVSGSLATNNSDEESDIDLLVIAKKRRIFTVRFFSTLILDLIGERRRPGRVAGKACLNQYQVENSLKVGFPSLYNAYTYLHLLPIINKEGIFEKFREENNWLQKYILFWQKRFITPFQIKKDSKIARILENILGGRFGDFVERRLRDVQIKRKKECRKGRIILTDNLIELHPDSAEERVLNEYQKRLHSLSLF